MVKKLLMGALLLVAAGLAVLHAYYPLDYVGRVMLERDADFDDFEWKPSRTVAASTAPRPWSRAPAPERVQAAFQSDPLVDDLAVFMTSIGTTALVVIRDGELVHEAYYNGSSETDLQATFSVTKSLLSILVGGAVARGELDGLEASITEYLPELASREAGFERVTLGNLLDMRSGLAYESSVGFPFINQDPPLIYYANDLRETVLTHTRIAAEPGTFLYNDYNPNLVGLALERATGRDLVELFTETVWQPLRTEFDAVWCTDYRGFPLMESGFVARARDLARLGQMMLAGGRVGDLALIPPHWHHRSTHRLKPHEFEEYNGRQWGYRNGWWIVSRPEDPPDYAAIGRFGQLIYVSPRNRVVIVRTGFDTVGVNDADLTSLFYGAADRL